jgi:bifunctional non-homologous end joining protein LigD
MRGRRGRARSSVESTSTKRKKLKRASEALGLQVYRKKRQFDVTSEPRGRQARGKGNRFVIQKHAATRLHYDFRLELDGVMKSWAVTRGPSLNPADKRLAVHVEDHPIEYNSFEGTIPKGQYGGGTVMIWDRGTWTPEDDPHKGYAKGHLAFELDGEKLHGKWHLVRMRGRGKEAKEPWLLIKSDDEWARHGKETDILEQEPRSVVTGRTIPEIAEGKGRKRVWESTKSVKANVKAGATKGVSAGAPRKSTHGARRATHAQKAKGKAKTKTKASGDARLPDFVPPSLATLSEKAPNNTGWVHEVKFDGYRIQARLDHGRVRLLTRKGLDWAKKFPNIAEAVAALPADTALIDGEIIVEDEKGVASFSILQADLRDDRSDRFVYYVFDLLHCDGHDLSRLPLVERKAELEKLVGREGVGPIKYSEHFADDGAIMLQSACNLGLEGIVSKRKDAPYRSGRSEAFLKIKCAIAQELVVGGYAPSNVMPKAIGALVVGTYEGGKLHYAGRVGTGYTQATAKDLWKRLHPLEIDKPPFDDIPREERRAAKWVKPSMVIEANLSGGWTTDGIVRQAAFKGVREDKPANEVFREVPAMAKTCAKKTSASKPAKSQSAKSPAAAKTAGKLAKSVPENEVRFTHPGRVYWEDVGVTKQDLADYYRAVWDWMAPQVVNRPLSFLRCPDGTKGQCFFQKHASAGLSEANLRTVTDKKRRQVIAIEDLAGLLSLVQAGILEVHIRGSTIEHLDLCERIVFDLDPGEGVTWSALVAAARDVRERLQGIGLESFVKLSGGKGLHVVLPVEGVDWETVKTFTQALAMAMAADDPKRYVAKMTKSLRGGKIFIDYLRNSLEQTSVAVYSTRARDGAPVSAPVTWEELGRTKGANQYTVLNLAKRLGALKRDPWADMTRVRQRLPDMRKLRKRG